SLNLGLPGRRKDHRSAWGKARPTYPSCLTPPTDSRRRVGIGVSEEQRDTYRARHQDADRDDQGSPDTVDVRRLPGVDGTIDEALLDGVEVALDEGRARRGGQGR